MSKDVAADGGEVARSNQRRGRDGIHIGECDRVTLWCSPDPPERPHPHASVPVGLEIDLGQRTIAIAEALESDPAAAALAKAMTNEITETDWKGFWQHYFMVKQDQTEHADLDQIDAHFPPEVMAEGSMVGYYEILSYAKPVEFSAEAQSWLFDDQYCVNPDCSCREAALSCIPRDPATGRTGSGNGPAMSIRYADDTGRIEALSAAGVGGLSAQAFLDGM